VWICSAGYGLIGLDLRIKPYSATFASENAVCLTPAFPLRSLKDMKIHFTPDIEAKLHRLAKETGRTADEVVQDALAGYFEELTQVRGMLDSRYDEIKSGQVQPIDGEAFFESLRQREEALLKKHTPQ